MSSCLLFKHQEHKYTYMNRHTKWQEAYVNRHGQRGTIGSPLYFTQSHYQSNPLNSSCHNKNSFNIASESKVFYERGISYPNTLLYILYSSLFGIMQTRLPASCGNVSPCLTSLSAGITQMDDKALPLIKWRLNMKCWCKVGGCESWDGS